MGRRCTWIVVAALLLLPGSLSAEDVLLLRSGDRVTGRIQSQDDQEVVINVYHSSIPGVSFGTEVYARREVARIRQMVHPLEELRRHLDAAREQGPEALMEVARWGGEERLPKECLLPIATLVLAAEPADEARERELRKLLGSSRYQTLLRTERRLNAELRQEQDRYLTLESNDERKALHAELRKRFRIKEPQHYYERAWRSQLAPRGYRENLPLTFRSAKIKGQYTLWVPESYDPFQSYPLVIGLHGGGVGGKDQDVVVGDGPSAMQKYRPEGEPRGYIVACPDAVEAGWGGRNSELIDALLLELELTYNIDCNRIFLVGHSMGGGGSWRQGPRLAEQLAGLGPLSSFGSGGFKKLADEGVAVYCYHGANDTVCPVSSGRNAARGLKRLTERFIYTEIPDSGHGFPREVCREMFDFFATKVRWEGKGKKSAPTLGPGSSFLMPVTPEEVQYLGDFRTMTRGGAEQAERKDRALLQQLLLGGGAGAEAATELGSRAASDRRVRRALGAICRDQEQPPDVRGLAARALGRSDHEEALEHLRVALSDGSGPVRSEAARALGQLGRASATEWLEEALARQEEIYHSKFVNGHVDYTDLEVSLQACEALLEGLRGVQGRSAADDLSTRVVEGVIMVEVQVDYTARTGENPARLRAKFVMQHLLPTYEALDDPAGTAGVTRLAAAYADRPDIARRAEALLARWRGEAPREAPPDTPPAEDDDGWE